MLDEAGIIALVLGIVEIVKNFGMPKKYLSIVAIVLGVGLQLLLKGPTVENGIMGVILGLSASGLFSGGKALIKK